MIEINEYKGDITNPYDPKYSLENYSDNDDSTEFVAGFLPGGDLNPKFASIDCHNNVVYCDPDESSPHYISQCQLCNSIGGGICMNISNKDVHTLLSQNQNNLENVKKIKLDISTGQTERVGICVPRNELLEMKINKFTTDVVVGIIGDYSHLNEDNGLVIEESIITKTTTCKDNRIVRKNEDMVRANPLAESFLNCSEIILCGGEGIGFPIHPDKNKIIQSIDDIDFDIVGEADLLTCGCVEGYTPLSASYTFSNLPTCQIGGGRTQGLSCPVTFEDGDTGVIRCLCNPSTQVSLYEIINSIHEGGLSSDYSIDMVEALSVFKEKILDGKDACIPKAGVDPRVSAFGYSFAAHLFYDKVDDDEEDDDDVIDDDHNKDDLDNNNKKEHNRTPFRLENNKGGHLMTGGLVRRGGVTRGGNWLSAIPKIDKVNKRASYSIGGVSPYLGTGGVPAHIWGGDIWNDNNIIVGPSTNRNNKNIIHPNGTLKMVPPTATGIPAVGISNEHAVGMVVSSGRYYPEGVYKRGGNLSTKGSNINKESCFLEEIKTLDKDNPLIQMMSTNDPGVCAAAFIVPFSHDKCSTKYEKDASNAHLAIEAPTQKLRGLTGHYHQRHIAMAMGYTPLERLFRYLCSSRGLNLDLSFPDKTFLMFPHIIQQQYTKEDWDRSFRNFNCFNDYNTIDLLGGLFIQPTTVCGSGITSLDTKWTEEMISVNQPCLIDHYSIDDGRAYSITDSELNYNKIRYPKYPTATNIIANQTSHYTGFSLPGGTENSGYSCHKAKEKEPFCFVDAVILGAENVIWNNLGFTPLALPQDIPIATLPEDVRFSKRNDTFGLSKLTLTNFKNKYANFEGSLFDISMEKDTNIYNPPALLPNVVNLPQKYVNSWIPGKVDGLVPSLNLAELFFRMRPFCSRNFFKENPLMLLKDWGTNPHTSGDLFQGIASSPCSKYELGGYMGYPSSGSLIQYLTLLTPRSFGRNGAAHTDLKPYQLLSTYKALSILDRDKGFDYLNTTAAKEECDCLTNIFCSKKKNSKIEKKVAATPSRGNRLSPYLFCRSTPKHHLPLLYSLLRAQNKDPFVLAAINEEGEENVSFNILKDIKTPNRELPAAANRFTAARNNLAFTHLFAREPIVPYGHVTSLESSSKHLLPLDYHSINVLKRDSWDYNINTGSPSFLLSKNDKGQLINRRLIDFFESNCRVAPNVILNNTFAAWHEGPAGIVALYGTPIMGAARLDTDDINYEQPMRMIHSYKINTPYMGGYECGQTPAEGMLTRGVEMWYQPFIKPPLGNNVTTTLEGIRARTQEPFEKLAIQGFRDIPQSSLGKYTLLNHYGLDALISFAFTDEDQHYPTRMTDGPARYPFACQSDRVPYPLSMEMTMQMRVLQDMGINKQVLNKLEFEERSYILSQH
uniref:Wsv209-like protein n=1 Tax=Trachysalambria curvirostris majanivirus TaxID=2984281 RepID=A0A9C7F0Q5_9VIRU|nr:MAG: wsv209-like protein [Trachysalambria curvirostris majanivirus]